MHIAHARTQRPCKSALYPCRSASLVFCAIDITPGHKGSCQARQSTRGNPPTHLLPTIGLCSQGDHTILSTARPAEAAPTSRPRAGSAGPSSTPVRKTPSPRPTPSPTNLGMGGSGYTPRTKTPPPPPMMLSSRSSAAFNERERRSPKSSERHSPTQGKGASSPTETVGGVKPKDKGHIRSMSASTTPTPPPQPKELCVPSPHGHRRVAPLHVARLLASSAPP